MSKIKKYKYILESLDYRYYIYSMFLSIIVIIGTIMLANSNPDKKQKYYFYGAIFCIMLLYLIIRMLILFLKYKNCSICEVQFDKLHFIGKKCYFEVFVDIDGNKVRKVTRTLFSSSHIGLNSLEHYQGKKVLIAYTKKEIYILTIKVINSQ